MYHSNTFENDCNDQIHNIANNTQNGQQLHIHESNSFNHSTSVDNIAQINPLNVDEPVKQKDPKIEKQLSPPALDVVYNVNRSHRPPLYPKGPDGKFDFSKSPAQQANPDKIFDSDVTVCYRNVNVSVRIGNTPPVPIHVATPFVDLLEQEAHFVAHASTRSTNGVAT